MKVLETKRRPTESAGDTLRRAIAEMEAAPELLHVVEMLWLPTTEGGSLVAVVEEIDEGQCDGVGCVAGVPEAVGTAE